MVYIIISLSANESANVVIRRLRSRLAKLLFGVNSICESIGSQVSNIDNSLCLRSWLTLPASRILEGYCMVHISAYRGVLSIVIEDVKLRRANNLMARTQDKPSCEQGYAYATLSVSSHNNASYVYGGLLAVNNPRSAPATISL